MATMLSTDSYNASLIGSGGGGGGGGGAMGGEGLVSGGEELSELSESCVLDFRLGIEGGRDCERLLTLDA